MGIAIGAMTLITVLGVMNGFQLGTIANLLEVGSYHIQMDDVNRQDQAEQIASSIPEIRAFVPFQELRTLIQPIFGSPRPALIRAVPHDLLDRDRGLADQLDIILGDFDLKRPNGIVMGAELARVLGVSVGYSAQIAPSDRLLRQQNSALVDLEVRGIFQTGHYEYDRTWAYISIDDSEAIIGSDIAPQLGIKLRDHYRDRQVIGQLGNLFETNGVSGTMSSWRDFNRSIFIALRLEKILMSLLLGLIFIVVTFNIYQSSQRNVLERFEEIATLKAVGMYPDDTRLIFALQGVFIGLFGGFFGVVAGLFAATNINEIFSLIEAIAKIGVAAANRLFAGDNGEFQINPFAGDFFYIEEVPTRILLFETMAIFMFASISATLAAYFASSKVLRARPAEILRYE